MRPVILMIAVTAFAWLMGGCSSAPALPAETIEAYAGTSEIELPDGRTFPGGQSLAQRTLTPARNMIVEQVVSPGGRPGSPPREFVVEMVVSGNILTMKERSGAFEGTGTLTGPAWAWTSWRTESTLPDGTRVVSEDTRVPDGLTARKTLYGQDGRARTVIRERFTLITPAQFAAKRAEMLGAVPTAKP